MAVSIAASRAASAFDPVAYTTRPARVDRSIQRVSSRSTDGDADRDEGVRALRESEPLKAGRQVLDPRAFRDPAKAIAQRDHGRERHDDGRNAKPGDAAGR